MHTALLALELGAAVAVLLMVSRALLERVRELRLIGGDQTVSAGPGRAP